MKNTFWIWIFMTVSYSMWGQVLTVRDGSTQELLVGASIFSKKPLHFTQTNERGQASVEHFLSAETIEISLLGYEKQVLSFEEMRAMNFEVALLSTAVSFDEVVVSATRWQQSMQEIPIKVRSISQKTVALQNPQTTADLLGASGAVFIQKSQQGGGSPMIRGFATNRLMYTVDGVRMNTAIFRAGNIQNVISLDPFAIESAEIAFGAGSVMYGSDAIGGVMSFQTLTPHLATDDKMLVTGAAVARTATANREASGHFHANVGWKKWAFVSSISTQNYGDLRMGNHGPKEYLRNIYVQRIDGKDVVVVNPDPRVQRPSGYSQINLMQKVRFQPSQKWDFQFATHHSETSGYDRYDRHIRLRANGIPRSGEWLYGPQIWQMHHLNLSHTPTNNVAFEQVQLRLAYQYFEESRIDRNFNDAQRRTRLEKVDAFSANLDFTKSWGNRHRLLYGWESVLNQVHSSGTNTDVVKNETLPGPSRYPQADWHSHGFYLTEQWQAHSKLTVQAGARYNFYRLNANFDRTFYDFSFEKAHFSNGSLTGSVGVNFRPNENWMLTANAATAFRSPNVDDMGKVFDSAPGSVVVPNPNLKSEYAYQAEVGIAKIFGKKLKMDATAYFTRLNDALVRRNFQLNGQDSILYDGTLSRVQAIQNAALAQVWGIQAGVEWKIGGGFVVSSDFNYQKGWEELDDASRSPLRHAPPLFGNSKLQFNAEKLTLQWMVNYSGEVKNEDMPAEELAKTEIYAVDSDGKLYSPSWYSLNFNALYRLNSTWQVSAGVENITDQRYRPYSSGMAGAGRNFLLSFRAQF